MLRAWIRRARRPRIVVQLPVEMKRDELVACFFDAAHHKLYKGLQQVVREVVQDSINEATERGVSRADRDLALGAVEGLGRLAGRLQQYAVEAVKVRAQKKSEEEHAD